MLNWTYVALILAMALGYLLCQDYNLEGFSKSGLNMSDKRCDEMLAHYHPNDLDPIKRNDYYNRICSRARRGMIDEATGNYFTAEGAYTLPVNHFDSKYL